MYKRLIRPVLFLFDPEGVHYFSFAAISLLHRIPFMGVIIRALYASHKPSLEREVFGLRFPNPVGTVLPLVNGPKYSDPSWITFLEHAYGGRF